MRSMPHSPPQTSPDIELSDKIARWFVDIPRDVVKQRLAKRHVQAGIESTLEAAELRAEGNDLPNGDLIRQKLIKPDVRIQC
jgi:pantothenate kinase